MLKSVLDSLFVNTAYLVEILHSKYASGVDQKLTAVGWLLVVGAKQSPVLSIKFPGLALEVRGQPTIPNAGNDAATPLK